MLLKSTGKRLRVTALFAGGVIFAALATLLLLPWLAPQYTLFSREAWGIFAAAQSVEVYRVHYERIELPPEEHETTGIIHGWPIVEGPVIMEGAFLDDLKRALKKRNLYAVEPWDGCGFAPRYAFRVRAENRVATMLVCLDCVELEAALHDTTGRHLWDRRMLVGDLTDIRRLLSDVKSGW